MVDKKKEAKEVKPQIEEEFEIDEELIHSVRSIIQLFVKTLAQVKLFSFTHANTRKFVDELYGKISDFLNRHGRLDLDIGEFTLLFQEKVVFEDRQINKSLPFLFHRDGLRTLSFHRGLEIEEIRDLFEIINEVSQLPPEEGDVVVLLWERDFANIHYYAPDEFLETKIGSETDSSVEYNLNESSLWSGHLVLSPEDRNALVQSKAALYSIKDFSREKKDLSTQDQASKFPLQLPSLSPEELETLEDMIEKNRFMASEEEFLSLIVEMSYLEERRDEFASIMEVLVQNHREMVQRGEFLKGSSLLGHIIDLKEELFTQSRERAERIDRFLNEIRSSSTLSLIEKTFDDGHVDNMDAFFKYIYLFGPYSMKLVGDLYEKQKDPTFRDRALSYLRYFVEEDLLTVMKVLGDHRPEFTKGILSLLREAGDDNKADHLVVFVDYKDPVLKKKAIRTLAGFGSKRAAKILARFLEDEDGSVRTEAALGLQSAPDESLLSFLMPQVKSNAFHRKDLKEKYALLGLLARLRSEEVHKIFRALLRRSHFLSPAGKVGTSMGVISALKADPSPESLEILRAGLRSTHPKVRKAVRKALSMADGKAGRKLETS